MKKIITVNLHFNNLCNMKCKGCYAHLNSSRNLSKTDWLNTISKMGNELEDVKKKKINFVGGEPTLIPYLHELIIHAKSLGFTTSMITNGALITKNYLNKFKNSLDWIGVSIDSMCKNTLHKLGRELPNGNLVNYEKVCKDINDAGINLKINTVVSQLNKEQEFFSLFLGINVKRWKVFQFLPIKGENEQYSTSLEITQKEFETFKENNSTMSMLTDVVYESNDDMIGSYIMVDPQGRPFSNNNNKLTYGLPILESGFIQQITNLGFNYKKFEQRGGNYVWDTKNNFKDVSDNLANIN